MQKQQNRKVVCNYCGSDKQRVIYDRDIYPVVSCAVCGLCFLSPRPADKSLKKLYNSVYFEGKTAGVGYTSYNLLKNDLSEEAKKRITLIKRYQSNGTLLDAGCGYGSFLKVASDNGFTVMGCDVAEEAIQQVKKTFHLPARVAEIKPEKLPKGPFDVITAWDVIEHMTNPLEALESFRMVQKPNGYLFMTTPDITSIDAKLLGKYWYGYKKIPEHTYFFSKKSIACLLEKAGYTVILIKPWGFHRNLAYCIDQIARYNLHVRNLIQALYRLLPLSKIPIYFPFIDMLIIAKLLSAEERT